MYISNLLSLDVMIIQLILAVIWLLLSIFLVIITLLLLKYLFHINKKDHVGYLPTDLKIVGPYLKQAISKYLPEGTAEYSLVEPGAGVGNVSYYLSQNYAWKQVLAIEDEPTTLFLASIKQHFRQKTVKFVKANLFEYVFPEKTVVYCYLLSDMLDKLYAKGEFKNKLVLSLTFPLKDITPTETFDFPMEFQKRLFVYDFRKNKYVKYP